jgi:hypothetical protein
MRPVATGVGGVTELAAAEVGGDAEPAAWAGVGGRDLEHATVGRVAMGGRRWSVDGWW